jgi:hypothetical protein
VVAARQPADHGQPLARAQQVDLDEIGVGSAVFRALLEIRVQPIFARLLVGRRQKLDHRDHPSRARLDDLQMALSARPEIGILERFGGDLESCGPGWRP